VASTRELMLRAARSDRLARLEDGVWVTRCLHCRSRLGVRADGAALGSATLEHVVPRSWADAPAAASLWALAGGPEDARNLALACARCNQQKGRRHDARGPGDTRAREVVERLLALRLERYVDPSAGRDEV
jgi:5-methylcytosine-specific restriction endonuclease McrA